MQINFNKTPLKTGSIFLPVFAGKKLGASAKAYDKTLGGVLTKALKDNKFSGKFAETLQLIAPTGVAYTRVVLIGFGKDALEAKHFESLGGHMAAFAMATADESASIILDDADLQKTKLPPAEAASYIGNGALLRSWRFDKYRTKLKPEQKPQLKDMTIVTPHTKEAATAFAPLQAVSDGIFFARHVVSEPGNVIYPESMADAVKPFTKLGIKVEILGEDEMRKLGMGALLGVGQGSERESKLIVLQWQNGPKTQAPIALIGKGVTFDTGGISIKPSDGMEEMKYDMAGSAAVAGTMIALAQRQAKANVVGIMGMVENMCSATAQRPGDIVTSMSGQTIEVLNTDAEGRLVLADAMWYAHTRFKPKHMVDLATLTGAITVALGHEYAGLFSNNDSLIKQLTQAGKVVNEKVWAMPMDDAYDRLLDSDAADMKNITGQRGGGSITAAKFLERFVGEGIAWAHLDIAGSAWTKRDLPWCAKGATGFGIRLLNEWIKANHEGA
jgi:leucyl aminopeptidase